MPRIRARILLNDGGQDPVGTVPVPLRYAYVRHEPFGPTYITDVNGVVRDRDGNEGVDSLTTSADLTIHCQNSVARVLDGTDILLRCPTAAARITRPGNGARDNVVVGTVNGGAHLPHFRVLNQAASAYHLVWRQFDPFRQAGGFPLGRVQDLETTRNRDKRIEVVFPSPASALPGLAATLGVALPATMTRVLSFTDPVGTGAGWPRIFVEPDPPEVRLFAGTGTFNNGTRMGLVLIPSEMAHALHFSLLSKPERERVRTDYVGFILGQLINGLEATHDIGATTTPMVAFIEALDHFSHRFAEHVRSRHRVFPAGTVTDRTRGTYAWDEMRRGIPGTTRVAQRRIRRGENPPIRAVPNPALTLNGSLDEGAIFGALFVDLAFRIGLETVSEAVLASKKLSFGEFRTWVDANRPAITPHLDAVALVWGL